MSAAAAVFWAFAAFTFGYGPAYVLTLILRDRRDRREEARLQAEEDRRLDEEWAAVVAATSTPVCDQLVCEAIERREWSS